MKPIVKAALAVAKKYPVFPTIKKMPCWSNSELGVGKGEGGYKIATQDPVRIQKLFSHLRAAEVAVPMGKSSGLMCIDVDVYKDPKLNDWVEENYIFFKDTLCHRTRSGGLHFIFKHPGDTIKFPATLRAGVDIKAVGTGYICFPPTEGYTVFHNQKPQDFPMDLLKEAMIAKGGTGSTKLGSAYNDATDEELMERIQDASDLYPALRSLSYRLPSRRMENGYRMTEAEMVTVLENLMDTSVAADPAHSRYNDWVDRREKIPHLVETSMEKERGGVVLTDEDIEMMTQGKAFIETQRMIASASRPIGPQLELTTEQIEKRITEMGTEDKRKQGSSNTDAPVKLDVKGLRKRTIKPLEWIIENMIPVQSTNSLAGQSNVGKTRFVASLVTGLAVGDTARMGLPQCNGPISTLWIANEEALLDISRRVKAVALQHDDKDSADIFVRGKDKGMLRLVGINEAGQPEQIEGAVASLVKWIREAGVKLLILDPYNTLSDGDENSAASTGLTTKAMLKVIEMTGCAVIHCHHTPKDRSKDVDWVRGDQTAWRGSSQIYSSLDCGYTLSNWMPKNAEARKAWKKAYLEEDLSKWVVLDVGKIREGEGFPPVVYQLVGQEMDEGEGRDIGVCRLATQAEAENALLHSNADKMEASMLGTDLIDKLGYGKHTSMTAIAKAMGDHTLLPNITKADGKQKMFKMFEETVACENGYVTMIDTSTKEKQTWALILQEREKVE